MTWRIKYSNSIRTTRNIDTSTYSISIFSQQSIIQWSTVKKVTQKVKRVSSGLCHDFLQFLRKRFAIFIPEFCKALAARNVTWIMFSCEAQAATHPVGKLCNMFATVLLINRHCPASALPQNTWGCQTMANIGSESGFNWHMVVRTALKRASLTGRPGRRQ